MESPENFHQEADTSNSFIPCADLVEPQGNRSAADIAYQNFAIAMGGVLMSLVIVLGCCGNVTICVVLKMRKMQTQINIYLIALAIWDFFLLICSFFVFTLDIQIYSGRPPPYGTYAYSYRLFLPLINTCRAGSAWILLATSVQRYLAICHPFQSQIHSSDRRKRMIVAIISLLGFLFNIPWWFEFRIDFCSQDENRTQPMLTTTNLRLNADFYLVYHVIISQIFITVGPFVITTILTYKIVCLLRKQNALLKLSKREHETGKRKRQSLETGMSKMLIAVAVKFLICLALPIVVDISEATMDSVKFYHAYAFSYVVDVSNFCIVANSAVNLAIYLVFCDRFRQVALGCDRNKLLNERRDSENTILRRQSTFNQSNQHSRLYSLPRRDTEVVEMADISVNNHNNNTTILCKL